MCGTGEAALCCARDRFAKPVTVKGFHQRRGDEIGAWREGFGGGRRNGKSCNPKRCCVSADEMSSGGQQAAGVAARQCNNETLFSDENMKHAQEMNAEK